MLKWKAWAILLLAMAVAVSSVGMAELEPETFGGLLQIDEVTLDDAQPIELDAALEEQHEGEGQDLQWQNRKRKGPGFAGSEELCAERRRAVSDAG